MSDPLIWFIIAILLLIGEFLAPGIVLLFFAIGAALLSGITLVFDISLITQLILFLSSSILSLLALRSKFKNTFFGNLRKAKNNDEFIGKIVEVKRVIKPNEVGKIELNGTLWNAQSEDNLQIGDKVMIIERKNLTLKVSKTDF